MSSLESFLTPQLRADIAGFSLHAAVRCAADDRRASERLCRHLTRSALANERVQCNAVGPLVLKLKTPWHDGTTHLVMSPLEFMQRLAGLFATVGFAAAVSALCMSPMGGQRLRASARRVTGVDLE